VGLGEAKEEEQDTAAGTAADATEPVRSVTALRIMMSLAVL
jgi:hypothetical protein